MIIRSLQRQNETVELHSDDKEKECMFWSRELI